MKVKTVRDHSNAYPPAYEKKHGRIYEIEDEAAAQTLIDAGYVEKHGGDKGKA